VTQASFWPATAGCVDSCEHRSLERLGKVGEFGDLERLSSEEKYVAPNPGFERVPRFCFLIGFLFITAGMYIGFECVLTMYCVGLGFVCCGLGRFVARLHHRQGRKENDQSIGIAE
jgi:hypothetical protein